MAEETERFDVKVLGQTIGTATGWDQMDDMGIMWYEFEPNETFAFLDARACLGFDPIGGVLEAYEGEGDEATPLPLKAFIGTLANLLLGA